MPEDRPAALAAKPGRIAGRRTVDLDRMSPPERAALGRTLYAVHRQIFAGISEAEFFDHVMAPPAERNMLQLYLDGAGTIVGYCAVHRFRRRVCGRDCAVIRAEAGLRPDFRGRGSTYWFGMVMSLLQKLRHPFTPSYYLGTLVHPSSYHFFCKYFPVVFPAEDRAAPEPMRALALDLIEGFKDPAVDPADPFVRDVGWITIETPEETRLARENHRGDVRFFVGRNPGYPKGHGLVVVVPLDLRNILGALAARIRESLSHRLRRRTPRL